MIEIFLPNWFLIKNNLNKNESIIGNIKAKTEKAILLKSDNIQIWIPKSIIIEFKISKDNFEYQSSLNHFCSEVNQ